MIKSLAMAAIASSLALGAHAAPAAKAEAPTLDLPLEGVRTNPDWMSSPGSDQVNAVYPKFALLLRLSGLAEIRCTAEPSGSVDDCHVKHETPVGLGFGAAAMHLAPFFHMRPATMDGNAVKGAINIPINFHIVPGANVRPAPPPTPAAVDPSSLALAREIVALQGLGDNAKRSLREWLDNLMTNAVQTGETRPSMEVIDAFQVSIDEASAETVEWAARRLAARATPDQLRAIRGFFQSPAGVVLARADDAEEFSSAQRTIEEGVIWVTHDRVCAKIACVDKPTK